jgi:hypothetical protein
MRTKTAVVVAGRSLKAIRLLGLALAGMAAGVVFGAETGSERTAGAVDLHWLDGGVPGFSPGVTWGIPWPRGAVKPQQTFALRTDKGESVPVQSWPLAYWPDGSLKWTAHAVGANSGLAEKLVLAPGSSAALVQTVKVQETSDAIEIDTGVIRCRVARRGPVLIESIERDGRRIAQGGHLVCLRQDRSEFAAQGVLRQEKFTGVVEKVTVEQSGPLRAVLKLEGKHEGGAAKRAWLPFTVRLYFYAGGDAVRIMHTFVFDGDASKDFIQGLGVAFSVPLRDLLHDRHVRFVGDGKGMWAEGVRNLTGLRRDAGQAVIQKQLAGEACPPVDQFPAAVKGRLDLIPAWNDYTLFQPTADSFEIQKRTDEKSGWLFAGEGKHASGLGYIGGASGGVAFGIRDFWRRYPTQLDVRGAATDQAEVTLWLWSPDARPMDLRFYHSGMGMDTYAKQAEGLEITYEDYEKGFGTPTGVARTSEIMLWAVSATPKRERLVEMADALSNPPAVVCQPEYYHSIPVFGIWSLPDRSTAAKQRIEDQLDWSIAYYQSQIEQHHWYGFWNYGDVMHTYDRDRHVWRYDVGGFAWDNSELSSDLWLWYSFLRSGRADLFRMAEAMTRHTGEVDVYHLGPYAGLGTRHGVDHWGDSAKQLRISLAAYRRIYYYLTGDERVGDLMHEVKDADYKLETLDPVRKLDSERQQNPYPAHASFGTDWLSAVSNWLTEWERTGNTKYRDKIITGMKCVGAMPFGVFSGDRYGYEPDTGKLYNLNGNRKSMSHLTAVFGAPEICAELDMLLQGSLAVPEFEKAWLQYCELYNASPEERQLATGEAFKGGGLVTAHSRLTAYVAWKKHDPKLAERAWKEFFGNEGRPDRRPMRTLHIEGPTVLNPVDEAPWVSTNDSAQWGLAAIQNLELIGDALAPEDSPVNP